MSRSLASVLVFASLALACSSDDKDVQQDASHANGDDEDADAEKSNRDAGKDAGRRDAAKGTPPKSDPNPVDPDNGTCAAITKEAPAERGKVDVLWVVDNSPSMADKILQILSNISDFYSQIEMAGADVHVVSISGVNLAMGTPLENDTEKHRFVPALVWSKLIYSPVLSSFSAYQDFLRPDAVTHIVAVSDDDDVMTGPDFRAAMEMNLGHSFFLHAISSEDFACSLTVGTNYQSLADDTGGEKISICSQDWSDVFSKLTNAVVAAVPLPCSYDMAEAAASQADKFDPAQVAVDYTAAESTDKQELGKASSADACGDKPGWYYDNEASPSKVELCPAACELVKAGGQMAIAFGCPPKIYL